jgi:hypothetical protein
MGTIRGTAGGLAGIAARGVALAVAVLAAGCSGGDGRVAVHPVKGKVTVAGEIPEGALIVLYAAKGGGAQELRPSARVAKDGSFSLTTYDAEDGAPTGRYTGTIQWNKLVKKGADYKAGPDVIPKAYASPEKSPWKIEVADAPKELPPLDIKK